MNTLNLTYGPDAEQFFQENFIIESIIPKIKYKNELCVLDWSNESFYLKIFINIFPEKIEIESLIVSSFEGKLLEDWLIFPCFKLMKKYGIKEILIPEASESSTFVLSKFGFVKKNKQLSCSYDKLSEYCLEQKKELND
jgi:hypothetical protein